MIFRFRTSRPIPPRDYSEWLCMQVSGLLLRGAHVSQVRFILNDAVCAAGAAHVAEENVDA